MNQKFNIRILFVILFCAFSFSSKAQEINIEGFSSSDTYNGYPLYYLDTDEIQVNMSNNRSISAIYIDDYRMKINNQGALSINRFIDGLIHKITVYVQRWPYDGYDDKYYCYFTFNKDTFINDIFYVVSENSAKVAGSMHNIENANIIDSYVHDGVTYSVNSISENAFYGKTTLKSVKIPNSVATIGDYAFFGCSNILSLTIGAKIMDIGYNAFNGIFLNSSKTIWRDVDYTIPKVIWLCNSRPNGYRRISATINYVSNSEFSISNQIVYPFLSSIFEVDDIVYVPVSPSERTCDIIDCNYKPSSTEFRINSTVNNCGVELKILNINNYSFYNNDKLSKLYIDYSGDIGEHAFYDCDLLKELNLHVKEIGDSAFFACAKREPAKFKIKAQNIGKGSFKNCSMITSLVVDANSIGESAFENCAIDESAEFEIKAETVAMNSFKGCSALSLLKLHANSIGNSAFENCSQMDDAEFIINANSIAKNAFKGCSSIVSANITSNYIENNAFNGASSNNVASYDLHNVKTIGEGAFSKASAIKTISLNDGISNLGNDVFSGCTSLTDITIPNSVTKIGTSIFSGCSSLESVIISNGISELPNYTFSGCASLGSIEIPANILTIGDRVFNGCSALEDVIIADRNTTLVLGTNGSSKPLFSDCPLKNVYIGGDISYDKASSSGYSPFYRNTSLENVIITDKETEVSDNEFYGCSNLKSISLGNRVETIGNFAFSGCSSLEDFSFGYSLKTIGDEAFSDCTTLTQLTSHALIPPTCGNQALDDINKWNCQLIVPEQSLDDYKSAPQWKEFFFIDGEDFGGIIIIDFDEITIKKSENFALTATAYIDNSESYQITWSSSNENIATVSQEGLVKGISVGTATITASCGEVSATCEVTVTGEYSGIEDVIMDSDSLPSVYSLQGFLVKDKCTIDDLRELPKGIYIIVTANKRYKISI